MASENTQPDNTSCWPKAPEGSDFRDKFIAFLDSPVDQHKICFKKTMADFREFMKEKLSFGSAKGDCTDGASCAKEIQTPTAGKATTSH